MFLYWLWEVLALIAFSASIESLGDRVYAHRESASRTLRSAGWRAYPALHRGLAHPDPEVRQRSARLLHAFDPQLLACRAIWVIVGPCPDARLIASEHALRYKLIRLFARVDLNPTGLDPSADPGAFECWLNSEHPWTPLERAIGHARACVHARGLVGRGEGEIIDVEENGE